jgi:hypothetical protein
MGASPSDPQIEHIGEKQVYVKLNKTLPVVILDKP